MVRVLASLFTRVPHRRSDAAVLLQDAVEEGAEAALCQGLLLGGGLAIAHPQGRKVLLLLLARRVRG